jgi:hypothetical protein
MALGVTASRGADGSRCAGRFRHSSDRLLVSDPSDDASSPKATGAT